FLNPETLVFKKEKNVQGYLQLGHKPYKYKL
ncbi:hypothetical protein BMETH_2091951982, partial [methanotrophic bacterial endosymbiont of Bathymodiolus sp.]